jgi:histidine triad (HIT) family protein
MTDCLFCKIIAREIPATIVHEDDRIVAIEDIAPVAPMHVLIIPKTHIPTLNELTASDDSIVGEMTRRAAAIARQRGFADGGYRTIFNTNREAGQSVFHIHLHALGGRAFGWPPG